MREGRRVARKRLPRAVALCAWLGCQAAPAPGAHAQGLEAGAAAAPITPGVEVFEDRDRDGRWDPGEPFTDADGDGRFDPVWLAGFGRGRLALGVHDDLWARCLVLRAGGRSVALVTLDLIGFTRDQVLQVRQELAPLLDTAPEAILVASSHTHHGPDVQGLWGPNLWTSGIDEEYRKAVRERIREVALRALQGMQPARAVAATVRVSGVVRDSRPPALSDERLGVLWLRSPAGRSIAVLANFGMHPEALDRDNRLVTSDYVDPLRREIERRLGGTALFVNADLGGMQTPDVREPSFAEAERVGLALAGAAVEAARAGRLLEVAALPWADLTVDLPMRNPAFHLARWLGVFREAPGLFEGGGLRVRVPCDLAMFRLGDAVFVSVPGELFPEIGEDLRALAGGSHQFILGLTNHSIGYIVPEGAWTLTGYEERVSLGRRTAPLLMEGWRELAARLGQAGGASVGVDEGAGAAAGADAP